MPNLGMNQVAVNPHVAKPSLHGDRLVRDHPNRAATGLIHFHGKTHGRIDSSDAALLQFGDDRCTDLIDLFTRSMEFEVGH